MNHQQSKIWEELTLVETKDGVKILAANYLVSRKTFKTFADAEKYLESKPLEVIINTVLLAINLNNKQNEKK